MNYYCYITFPTTFYAIRAEFLLKKESYKYKMVPVPRIISSSCGTALRCDCADLPVIKSHLIEHEVEMESCYKIEENGIKFVSVEELPVNE